MKPSRESRVAWRNQRNDLTIIELRQYAQSQRPKLEGNTFEQIALGAKAQEGFDICMEAIFEEFTVLPLESPDAGFMSASDDTEEESDQ